MNLQVEFVRAASYFALIITSILTQIVPTKSQDLQLYVVTLELLVYVSQQNCCKGHA